MVFVRLENVWTDKYQTKIVFEHHNLSILSERIFLCLSNISLLFLNKNTIKFLSSYSERAINSASNQVLLTRISSLAVA